MIEVLKQKVEQYSGNSQNKYNYLRELLQLLILKIIDETNYFQKIAFVGGTALRILYDLERFSEDLDFSLINPENFNFKALISALSHELKKQSLDVATKSKTKEAVCYAQIKFNNLLHDFGLSAHKNEVIMVKIEVDCKPPPGYQTELSVISKEYMIAIHHFDLPSLFAGKLHAILQRKYTKGRDYYDYLWFQGQKIKPNLTLLNNALTQTAGKHFELVQKSLNESLKKRFMDTDFSAVKKDIEPFLRDSSELRLFTREIFLQTLKNHLY